MRSGTGLKPGVYWRSYQENVVPPQKKESPNFSARVEVGGGKYWILIKVHLVWLAKHEDQLNQKILLVLSGYVIFMDHLVTCSPRSIKKKENETC